MELYNKINEILSEWDPLGVGTTTSLDEYRGYIPSITRSLGSKESITKCLVDILHNQLGIDQDFNKTELYVVVLRLAELKAN